MNASFTFQISATKVHSRITELEYRKKPKQATGPNERADVSN
jgi:hypothetical protein